MTPRKPRPVEHPRCDICGWTLAERLTGERYCPHAPACELAGQTVDRVPREIGVLAVEV